MGIDRLTKAANAAGYAMVNSEDLLAPTPAKKAESPNWRPAEPTKPARSASATASSGGLRDWWFSPSGKATA
jgi:hypothetical protein